jgi:hypothetical protein
MGSNLMGIYDALAAVQVPVNGVIVPVRNVDELPESVAAADCPVRLLMPWSERTGTNAVSFVTFGGMAQSDWTIVDLLLLRPAQAGKLETASAGVVRYMQDYATAINRVRALSQFAQVLGPVRFAPGVGAYPTGGAAQWFGVEVTLTVRETWR